MSTIQKFDKWDKLARFFGNATEEQVEKIKAKLGVKEVCVQGLTRSATGSRRLFSSLLKDFGFTKNDIYQNRACVINGCPYTCASLSWMFNHYIGYHKVPIRNLSKMVPVIKSDMRKPKLDIKKKFQTVHMNTD